MIGIVPPHLGIECFRHGTRVLDVVWMRMREDDRVECLDRVLDTIDDVEIRPRIDENSPLTLDEEDVARKGLYVSSEIPDHDDYEPGTSGREKSLRVAHHPRAITV